MEKQLRIKTPDDKIIYGVIGRPRGRSRGTIILVHGLGGTDYWPPLLEASRFFRRHGYITVRFSLYGWMKGARRFVDTSLTQHAIDLRTVANYLKKRGHKRLLAIGHSFGGLTILRGDASAFTAISLWDPSSLITHPPDVRSTFIRKYQSHIVRGQVDFIFPEKYRRDLLKFPNELELIAAVTQPIQICFAAGKSGVLKQSSKRYFKNKPSLIHFCEKMNENSWAGEILAQPSRAAKDK